MEHSSIERFVIPNDALQRLISDHFPAQKDSSVDEVSVAQDKVIDISLSSSSESTSTITERTVSPTQLSWAKDRSIRNVELASGWASGETFGRLDFGAGLPDWTFEVEEESEMIPDPRMEPSVPVLEAKGVTEIDSRISDLLDSSLQMQREILSRLDQVQSKMGKLNTDRVRIDLADFSEESHTRSNTVQRAIARIDRNFESKIGLVILLASLGGLAGGTALAISLIRLFA